MHHLSTLDQTCPVCFAAFALLPFKGRDMRELIAAGRKRLCLSEAAFAMAAGVTRGAVQQWEKIGGTAPARGKQLTVANLLGMSVSEFLSGGPRPPLALKRYGVVRVVSEIEAGGFAKIDNFTPPASLETVQVTVEVKKHTFALRVHGNSMQCAGAHSFPEGTIIVVEPDMKAKPNDFVVAIDEAGKATFKQLASVGGELVLKPLNGRFKTVPLGSARVIGVVREAIRRFR